MPCCPSNFAVDIISDVATNDRRVIRFIDRFEEPAGSVSVVRGDDVVYHVQCGTFQVNDRALLAVEQALFSL